MKNQLFILFVVLFATQLLHGQIAHVKMLGTISAESGNYNFKSNEFPIEIWGNGQLLATHFPDEEGSYEITLSFGMDYRIRFGNNPWVVKMVDVNLNSMFFPAGDIGFTLQNDISLFRHIPASDFQFLETTPVAVANFDYDSNCMVWDTAHNQKLTDSIIYTLKNTNQLKSMP